MFDNKASIIVNTVIPNEDYKARTVEDYTISIRCSQKPKNVLLLPEENPIEFGYENGFAKFASNNKNILNMYKVIL